MGTRGGRRAGPPPLPPAVPGRETRGDAGRCVGRVPSPRVPGQDHPGADAAREAPLRDPDGGSGCPALPPPAALRRRQQPPELPRPAGYARPTALPHGAAPQACPVSPVPLPHCQQPPELLRPAGYTRPTALPHGLAPSFAPGPLAASCAMGTVRPLLLSPSPAADAAPRGAGGAAGAACACSHRPAL